ncbi:MAG: S9 family peptidase [Saprospiraceae bacterium]|nr:S9 family peptidase [Candidatus Vicinibacter affinis]
MKKIFSFISLNFFWVCLFAQVGFQTPPEPILALAEAKTPSQTALSRHSKYLALIDKPNYKSLEDLAEPEIKLAGLRFNPENFNSSRNLYFTSLTIQNVKNKSQINIQDLPFPLKFQSYSFSPRENYFSFIQVYKDHLSLWVINLKTGKAKEILNQGINSILGNSYSWAEDESFIICRSKGAKSRLSDTRDLPKGPIIQETTGEKLPARTFQDLLKNQQDEGRFDYYAACTLVKVYPEGELPTQDFLGVAVYKSFSFSPDGKFLLTEELSKPYSYTLSLGFFPSKFNIYNSNGVFVKTFYNRPLNDLKSTSFDAVEAGKRNIFWRSDKPATLFWCEATDGGNPTIESEFRDKLFISDAPFNVPKSICFIKNRFANIIFANENLAIVEDRWWKNRNTKTYIIDPSNSLDSVSSKSIKVIFDRSSEDLYNNPGSFISKYDEKSNREVLLLSKDHKKAYLNGEGYSPVGNRPFLDEIDLSSFVRTRLWQADGVSTYEKLVRVLDINSKLLLTSIQSPTSFPNLYIRDLTSKQKPESVTFRENPYKSIENITKKKIHYLRKDGVSLSATLYLPVGYNPSKDGRLPLLMEAYPEEFKDDKTAGQVKDSPHFFNSINWASPLFWVTRGFAVLENTQFPIIGKGDEEPNDTYLEQLVADAEAAIKAVDSLGYIDPARCAVMGHSYGAFMTANLLAHSNLFVAGIARSGAYNRSLTPFGFQSEERTYWQAQDKYNEMSPFNYAHQIKSPILLIHGESDNNSGTFTMQTERFFQAIKGNGGKARMVILPFESHGYSARENILHMLWEMDSWLEKYVKNKTK